ncbi:MAG: hypothetical protein ABSD98_02330 [Candidatus Korobacteraceae bacterium]|jgi:hypothetical protein
MKATDFEYRRQTLVHQFIVAAAFLTYFVDREDIVWRFVKDSSAPRGFERLFFIVATVFIVVGAAICTSARVCRRRGSAIGMESYRHLHRSRYFGDFLYAIGLASLFPLWGFIILVAGEALRVLRLIQREDPRARNLLLHMLPTALPLIPPAAQEFHSGWGKAFRQETVKWGLFLTMVVFVITLKDRLAEVLAAASFLIGLLVNTPIFSREPSTAE